MTSSENLQAAVSALEALAALELQTIDAETNVFGLLRDHICPVARFGEPIPVHYSRQDYKTAREKEAFEYLAEGFPLHDGLGPLPALLVADGFTVTSAPASSTGNTASPRRQFGGQRLYLSRDRSWILAERTGTLSDEEGSSSEWIAKCRVLPDRALLECYSLEAVSNGLLAATTKTWEKLSPRMESLRLRAEAVKHIAEILRKLEKPRLNLASPASPGLAMNLPARYPLIRRATVHSSP